PEGKNPYARRAGFRWHRLTQRPAPGDCRRMQTGTGPMTGQDVLDRRPFRRVPRRRRTPSRRIGLDRAGSVRNRLRAFDVPVPAGVRPGSRPIVPPGGRHGLVATGLGSVARWPGRPRCRFLGGELPRILVPVRRVVLGEGRGLAALRDGLEWGAW